jgi:acetyl-CoA synthetase
MARTIFGDHARFMDTYFAHKGHFLTGDRATRDHDGYYWSVCACRAVSLNVCACTGLADVSTMSSTLLVID